MAGLLTALNALRLNFSISRNPTTGSYDVKLKGGEIGGGGGSIEFDRNNPSQLQIEGLAGGSAKIGGSYNYDPATNSISGANLTLEIPLGGAGSLKLKIEPGPPVPHPTDPNAPPIPSATFQPQITLGPLSLEFPKSDPITTDNLFDPEYPGSPLSGGMLGEAYRALRHRQREIDGQVDDAVNGRYNSARAWRQPVDPLMLDLDGDGLELKRADGSVLFDHNADGVRTGTGWVGADDGILVRDVNGNGSIDSGRELFGVDTIKTNGQNASNGFDALADLDSNGDGSFTALDLAWNQVKVWRDLNQDGVSDAGELFGLEQLGISRIGVIGSATNATGGTQAGTTVNGNLIAQSASFTRGGETHTVSAVSLSAGAIDLESNNFHREFTDHIPLTPVAVALPKMRGSGMVRDLAEAVSLDADVATSLTAFSIAPTRDMQRALLDDLLTEWAKSSDFWSSLEQTLGGNVEIAGLPEGMTQEAYRRLIAILEVFNGDRFYRAPDGINPTVAGMTVSTSNTTGPGGVIIVTPGFRLSPSAAQLALLQQSYDALKDGVYGALVTQTRLRPYLDSVELTITENGIGFNTALLAAKLDSYRTVNEREAFIDLVELNRYESSTLQGVGFDGIGTLRTWIDSLAVNSQIRAVLLSLDVLSAAMSEGTSRSDIYLGDVAANSINGGAGNDILDGAAGNDLLQGGEGNDTLDGGAGNDTLAGGFYDTWNGNYGGAGNDTYLFGRGGGQDVIYDNSITAGNLDALVFKAGIAASDVEASRSGDHLVLKIAGTTDQVTIQNYFTGDGTSGWQIEEIRFADDAFAVWRIADIKLKMLTGGVGNDTIIGYATADTLNGAEGADTLYGRDGNDLLNGGDGSDSLLGENGNDALNGGVGNDLLQGGAGDDVLDGGAGNDTLAGGVYDTWNGYYGGTGNDTYLFGRGDGQDVIYDNTTTAGNLDTLVFKAGVAVSDIQVSRSGENLVLKVAGTTDQVTIQNYFTGDGASGWQIEEIRFNDDPSTVWRIADIKLRALSGGAGNDTLIGYATADTLNGAEGSDTLSGRDGDDTLNGGEGADSLYGENGNDVLNGDAGNDLLQGGAGDDVLDGGAGNDTLAGGVYDTWNGNYSGTGNDTYLFGRGDGQDVVYDNTTTVGNLDTLIFKAGVAASDVEVVRSGDHLVLKIAGTTDQVTIQNYFTGDVASGWQIEEIRFADDPATVWSIGDIKLRTLSGGPGNDTIIGHATADTLNGADGADTLYGRDGNDTLNGGEGGDTLYGENGNDTLNGGVGNDLLQGGAGNDVLDGGAGNDTLAGGVYDTWNGNYSGTGNDTYLFGRGDGQDLVYDNTTTVGNLDTLIFKTGVAAADVQVVRSGDHLVLTVAGTTDQLTIQNYFTGDAASGWQIEEIRFNDDPSTVWSIADIKLRALSGGAGSDTLIGYATADTLNGVDGADTLYGRDGNDTLNGGDGGDTLYGENGNDTLNGGAGNDLLQGGAGDDVLDGGVGNDTLAGGIYDTWNGNYSGTGNDTYLFGRGDGQDLIYDNTTTVGNLDTLVFKAGVAASDVQVVRSGDHLILKIAGTTDQVTVQSYFIGDAASGWQIEEIRFADDPATVWRIADIKLQALSGGAGSDTLIGYGTADTLNGADGVDTLYGRDGNDTLNGGEGGDTLYGENGNDTLNGGAGNDLLQGGAGDDVLDGGAGNDTLAGGIYDTWNGNYSGTGNDTYLFGRGDGQDLVYDNTTTAGNLDTLVFKAGVAASDVQVVRSGDHLVLKIAGTTDQVTIQNYFTGDAASGWQVEEIRFTDDPATVWRVADIKLQVLTGGAGNDTLIGYATADTLNGADGADTLYGRDGNDILNGGDGGDSLLGENGNDTLNGGVGNDLLQGGAGDDVFDGGAGNDTLAGGVYDTWNGNYSGTGNDTYLFGRGDGQDVIYDNTTTVGNLDTLVFKAGVAVSDIQVSRSGENLVLKVAGTTDQVTVQNYFTGDGASGWQVEEIRFTDDPSTVWSIADVKSRALTGTTGSDTLIGYATADTLNAAEGADTLYGRDGNDTLNGGDGGDSLFGENGNDVLNGDAGNDLLQGGAGDDVLAGGAGNDILAGGIYDTWNGNYSGPGNDTYLFGRDGGQDRIVDTDATVGNTDALVFGADISTEQLWFRQVGADLEVSIIGTSDKATISNWYTGSAYRVEQFKTSDGRSLSDSNVQSLVQAMASFAPPAAGQTTLPRNYQTSLSPVIAASWQ